MLISLFQRRALRSDAYQAAVLVAALLSVPTVAPRAVSAQQSSTPSEPRTESSDGPEVPSITSAEAPASDAPSDVPQDASAPSERSRQRSLMTSLTAIDAAWRQAQLDEAKIGIGGPLVCMIAGYALSLSFTIAGWAWSSHADGVLATSNSYEPDTDFDFDDSGTVDKDDERYARRRARAWGGAAVAALGAGIASHRWALRRSGRRQELGVRTRELGRQRLELLEQLHAAPSLSSRSWGVSLRATF